MATAFQRTELLTVEEFLEIDFGDKKAELDDGVIRMMAGGTGAHSRVARNLIVALTSRLRGTGCGAYTSDMGLRSGDRTLRFPDVAVYCGRDEAANDGVRQFDDPIALIEVLSESTRTYDFKVKLAEYQTIASVRTILFVDADAQRVRLIERRAGDEWNDVWLVDGEDVAVAPCQQPIPQAEIFIRD